MEIAKMKLCDLIDKMDLDTPVVIEYRFNLLPYDSVQELLNDCLLYEEIKGGYTDKMSFCFVVSNQKRDTEIRDGKTVVTRRITGISKLYDVSAVSVPANDSTSISARGFADGVIAELTAERLCAADMMRKKLALKLKMEA